MNKYFIIFVHEQLTVNMVIIYVYMGGCGPLIVNNVIINLCLYGPLIVDNYVTICTLIFGYKYHVVSNTCH